MNGHKNLSQCRLWWTVVVFAALLSLLATTSLAYEDDDNDETSDFTPWDDPEYPIVDWLRGFKGGFFADFLQIRKRSMLSSSQPSAARERAPQEFGIFALKNVGEGEMLMGIPLDAILERDDDDNEGDDDEDPMCADVRAMVKGHQSKLPQYYPYTKFILDNDSPGSLRDRQPVSWSPKGQEILWGMLDELMDPQPNEANHSFAGDCGYPPKEVPADPESASLHEEAYKYIIAKGLGDILFPLYELIQHRGGNWRNVALRDSPDGSVVQVVAFRDIDKGEQLYKSFNRCDFYDGDCEHWDDFMAPTADLFRDAGIVEAYPRRWVIDPKPGFDQYTSVFDIDKSENGSFEFTWLTGTPTIFGINFMRSHFEVLEGNRAKVEQQVESLESAFESESILKYHTALKEALYLAWLNRNGDASSLEDTENAYDPFEKPKGAGTNPEDYFMCYIDKSCLGGEYDTTFMESMYQDIKFQRCPQTDDSCLELTGIIQACTSFRPHYHESFVHVPAQYAKEMKRVAYLGGGDSMLLHEILKYPDLDLVVGLELDQAVVRYSFKHFGTSPYFHDPRVQWWFGDASKSFLALPKEYYGTFDLVIVDLLSYIVDTLKVANGVTLMDAAKLLMKGDGGIIVKQEDFSLSSISKPFAKYTVDFEFKDLPYLCQQHITMGSNSIDFFSSKRYSHGIKTIVRDHHLPQSINEKQINLFHSWQEYHNVPKETCRESVKTNLANALPAESAQFGVLLIIEAQSLNLTESFIDFKDVIKRIATQFKLSEINKSAPMHFNQTHFLTLFQEGYIILRAFPESEYVGFDVMMWDTLENVDEIKQALVLAVGGDPALSTSSFRIVSGGMMGLKDGVCQKQELASIAQNSSMCITNEAYTPLTVEASVDIAVVKSFSSTIISNIADGTCLIVIICGNKDKECRSLTTVENFLQKNDQVTIVPLFFCDSLISDCQSTMLEQLSAASKDKRIDGIIVDALAARQTTQMLHKILADTVHYEALMESNHLVLSPIPDDESWQCIFVDRFRTELGAFFVPSYTAHFQLLKDNKRVAWCVFSGGDAQFLKQMVLVLETVQNATGWGFEVNSVDSGMNKFIVDFGNLIHLHDRDYDKRDASEQWHSQQHVGYQAVIQMENTAPKMPLRKSERVLVRTAWDGPWDREYKPAVILDIEVDNVAALVQFEMQMQDEGNVEFVSRERIRRLSTSDTDNVSSLQEGDIVLYESELGGTFENCMISAKNEDGETFDLTILSFEARKYFNVPKDRLRKEAESSEFLEERIPLTMDVLLIAFKNALLSLELSHDESLSVKPISFPVGSGGIAVAFWSHGSLVMKWNGRDRVELNLYLDHEDREATSILHKTFSHAVSNLQRIQMDEFPRGYGNIVNFESHVKDPPHWLVK